MDNKIENWEFKVNPWITMIPIMLSIFMFIYSTEEGITSKVIKTRMD